LLLFVAPKATFGPTGRPRTIQFCPQTSTVPVIRPSVTPLLSNNHANSRKRTTFANRKKAESQHLQIIFNTALLIQRHLLIVLFVVFPLGSLQVEPHIRERLDVRQQCLDKRMILFLYTILKHDLHPCTFSELTHELDISTNCNLSVQGPLENQA